MEHVGNNSVSLLQLSAPSAPCLVLPAPAAGGYHATTTTSSPPSACNSGTAVATATATTLWLGKSARGHVRFLHQAIEENLPLKGPHPRQAPLLEEDLEQVDLPLEGQQVQGHATWGGFSQSKEVRSAAPAGRPQVLPHMLTGVDSICASAGLPLLLLHSTGVQQRGKTLKTQEPQGKAYPMPRLQWHYSAVNSLPTPAEEASVSQRVSWRRLKHHSPSNHVHHSLPPQNTMMKLMLKFFLSLYNVFKYFQACMVPLDRLI